MIEHRKELRERVEERQRLLQEELKASEKAGHPSERISAIQNELTIAKDSTGAGWEKMTEVSAERLCKWLAETLRLLPHLQPVGVAAPIPPAPVELMAKEVNPDQN
jgi:hypothetical protein